MAVRLKLGVQGQGSGRILDVAGKGGGVLKIVRHIFIIPNAIRFDFATSYIFPSPLVL